MEGGFIDGDLSMKGRVCEWRNLEKCLSSDIIIHYCKNMILDHGNLKLMETIKEMITF